MASCGAWACLLAARGGFWLAAERDDSEDAQPIASKPWPSVVAIVPARNEAQVIAEGVRSLLCQRYPGPYSVVLVDDQSDDGTAEAARSASLESGAAHRLSVLTGAPLPHGWTGKLWAVSQGIAYAEAQARPAEYLLLTDADIAHSPDSLLRLVARARAGGLVLTSAMAKLRCMSPAERALIPAFVFFFQMLYPFAWVNRARRGTAAAAGGCMLVLREALHATGGIAAMRSELIDDCALARQLKTRGPIWLGLTVRVRSLRAYSSIGEIRRMVARSAYAQLRYSPVLLLGTTVAMTLVYLAPPAIALSGTGAAKAVAIAAWGAMALALQPILRFYRRSPLWGLALPAIAAAYLAFTFDSAYQHWRGRGGMWKGRARGLQPRP
jgi:hopene-associated glycosyltransferase HpnB